MRRKIAWVLILMMVWISASLTACGGEEEKAQAAPMPGPREEQEEPTAPVPVQSTFLSLEEKEETGDSLDDLMAASPLYLSTQMRAAFDGHPYLEERDSLLNAIESEFFLLGDQIDHTLYLIDELQWMLISRGHSAYPDDPEVQAFLSDLEAETAAFMIETNMALGAIEIFRYETQEAYTDSWQLYTAVKKRQMLAMRIAERYTRVLGMLALLDAYDGANESIEAVVDYALGQAETYDQSLNKLLATVDYIDRQLAALDQADTYAEAALLADVVATSQVISNNLSLMTPKEGLEPEELEMIRSNQRALKELALLLGAGLVESHGLTLPATESASYFPVVHAATGESSKAATAYAQEGAKALASVAPKKETASSFSGDFFETVGKALRKTPGLLIEKAGNAIYKKIFELHAKSYGVDEETIDREMKRVEEEEWARIKAGEAGSEQVQDSIAFIERAESSLGELVVEELGESSRTAKVFKAGTSFVAGLFTGSAKSTLKLMDPKATTGEIALATVDVAMTTASIPEGLKKFGKGIANRIGDGLTFVGEKAQPYLKYLDDVLEPAVKKVSAAKGKILGMGDGALEGVDALLGASTKKDKMLRYTVEQSGHMFREAADRSGKTFTQTRSSLPAVFNRVKAHFDDLAKKTTVHNELIDEVLEGGVKGALDEYALGLMKDEVVSMIDEGFIEEARAGASTDGAEEDRPPGQEEDENQEAENAGDTDPVQVVEKDEEEVPSPDPADDPDSNGETDQGSDAAGSSSAPVIGDIRTGTYTGYFTLGEIWGMEVPLTAEDTSVQLVLDDKNMDLSIFIDDELDETLQRWPWPIARRRKACRSTGPTKKVSTTPSALPPPPAMS